jgi:hypothetical protein
MSQCVDVSMSQFENLTILEWFYERIFDDWATYTFQHLHDLGVVWSLEI